MNKEKMTAKVADVLEAKEAVNSFLDEIEFTAGQHGQAVTEMQEQLAKQNEAFKMATDLSEAKMLKAQVSSTEEDMELVKQVSEAKVSAMYQELENKAEAFFAVHKEADAEFRELDKAMMANTGLGQLQEHMELMSGFANTLNNSFAGVRAILLDTKIVPMSEQNGRYKGKYHLGQRGLVTELNEFNYKVAGYVRDLRSAGKL